MAQLTTAFFGSPSLAAPFLERLRTHTQVAFVVTTPDEPSGRGQQLKATPVKEAAQKAGLPVHQPEKLKDPSFLSVVRQGALDLGLVVAYGKILPKELFEIPRLGFLNVHFSLLPAYRGAAPIQWALIHGEKKTGVTLFWIDEGMDTGPILLQKELPIESTDTALTLEGKLVPLGVAALEEALDLIAIGKAPRAPQQGPSSLAPRLTKELGHLPWDKPAEDLANLIRGVQPWPGAYCFVQRSGINRNSEQGMLLKILEAVPSEICPGNAERCPVIAPPGQITGLEARKSFVVQCGRGFLKILKVQPEGKKAMSAWDFWQGARLKIADKLT